ncbi:MAG: sulfurtransferase, partial [Cellulomonas sp.]|nr:sulfurtransferase [Cellulomonas sp.]
MSTSDVARSSVLLESDELADLLAGGAAPVLLDVRWTLG